MVIFFILGTVVLWSVIVGTESEAAYPILYVWFFLAFARYKLNGQILTTPGSVDGLRKPCFNLPPTR